METNKRYLRLYETTSLLRGDGPDPIETDFVVNQGSRLIFSLYVVSISAGAQVSIDVANTFDQDLPYQSVLAMAATAVGYTTRVLTDCHNQFRAKATVTGGTAVYRLGITIVDNALATRIENAVVEVALGHMAGVDGRYDSVRVGDGVDELQVRKAAGQPDDGSLDIYDIGYSLEARVKWRLCHSPDLLRAYTFTSIDGVWRVTKIEHTSAALDAIMVKAIKLTRTFTYKTSDPFTLESSTDALAIVAP